MHVKPITRSDCEPFIIGIHYAHRWPSISYAFGLYDGIELIGVVTYGTPPSAPLRRGIAGDNQISNILELNRLCLRYNRKNEASMLVGRSLKLLPPRKFVVSFADTSQGHEGIVYRAANFGYYGLSAKRTDWKLRSRPHLHGQTVADEFRGQCNRSALMREKYGDDFYLEPRPRKHRYIYVTGTRKDRIELEPLIKYDKQCWKGSNQQA